MLKSAGERNDYIRGCQLYLTLPSSLLYQPRHWQLEQKTHIKTTQPQQTAHYHASVRVCLHPRWNYIASEWAWQARKQAGRIKERQHKPQVSLISTLPTPPSFNFPHTVVSCVISLSHWWFFGTREGLGQRQELEMESETQEKPKNEKQRQQLSVRSSGWVC